MKKFTLTTAAFALLLVVLSSCTQGDISTLAPGEVESVIPGAYKVTLYDNGSGNTSAFESYDFEFMSNGSMVATHGEETYTGQWNVGSVNHETYDNELSIVISGNADIDAISRSWYVEDVSDVTLYLTDATATEIIHFIKD